MVVMVVMLMWERRVGNRTSTGSNELCPRKSCATGMGDDGENSRAVQANGEMRT